MSISQIYDSFCYNGQPFKLVYKDIIAYIQGGVLYLWDLSNNTKDYISSDKHGFQSFATNPHKGIIVIAEYSHKPKVYVYKFPMKKLIKTISGISELEILDMDISLDGEKLLCVIGVPSYYISIWDLESGTRLEGTDSTVPLRQKFISAKFSPQQDTTFAVLFENNLQLCEIYPSYETKEVFDSELEKRIRIGKQSIVSENSKYANFIWDDQNNIYLADGYLVRYLNGKNLQQILEKDCQFTPSFFVLTPKHLIVVLSNGRFEWVIKYDPSNLDDKEFLPFKLDKSYMYDEEKIISIMYNQSFTKIYAGTEWGCILTFPQQAEQFDYEGEEEQDLEKEKVEEEEEDASREISLDVIKYGPFHTGPVVFIKEFINFNTVISISQRGRIFFWDIQRRELISSFKLNCEITCADIDHADQLMFLGSKDGVIRVVDIQNVKQLRILKQIRLFKNKPISCVKFNPPGNMVSATSKESKKIFFVNATKAKGFKVIGFCNMLDKVNTVCWNNSKKQSVQNDAKVLFVVLHYFLIAIVPPKVGQEYKELLLSDSDCQVYGRKIDPELYNIEINPMSGDIYCSGNDKIIKKYKQPEDLLIKLDVKVKVGPPPQEEIDGHSLPINCLKVAPDGKQLITGSQDGTIYIRKFENLSDFDSLKCHNLMTNGCSALEHSNKYKLIYSGGYDGSFFIWQLDEVSIKDLGTTASTSVLQEYEDMDDLPDSSILHYKKVLEEEFIKSQKEIREKQKEEIFKGLNEVKELLQVLLNNNEQADELETLDRDEFVIDIETKDNILQEGKKQCDALRHSAKREDYKKQILHKRLQEITWDKMQDQLKAMNALDQNIIIYNYHIRKRTKDELRFLEQVKELRKLDLKEKQMRKDAKINEIVTLDDFSKTPPAYIVNATSTKPDLVLVDYEAKEEQKTQEAAGKGGGAGGAMGAAGGLGAGRAKVAKKDDKKQAQENQEKEDLEKKKKEEEEKSKEKEQDTGDLNEWEYLYGALELFTNNRKRSQIVLLHNIIFKIKEEYNKEFEKLMKLRANQLDSLNDKNKRIEEILTELRKPIDIFRPKKNILENPEDRIMTVDGAKEIPFIKFLTREERKKIEDEKKKEEERLKLLMSDDAGLRAIKQMMGGTLEEKKENALDEALEVEDWMSKPQEEMNEEQKLKFKEYEVKKASLEEEKEKIRKNLENELKKLKNEVVDVCQKFDQKLLILFRRKLEYDYRIDEQELYIVRLSLSLLFQNDATVKKGEYVNTISILEQKNEELLKIIENLTNNQTQKEADKKKKEEDYQNAFNSKNFPYGLDISKLKPIWTQFFGEEGKKVDEKKKKEQEDKMMADPNLKDQLIPLDPYLEVRKKNIKKHLESMFENVIDDMKKKILDSHHLEAKNEEQGCEYIIKLMRDRYNFRKEKEELEIEVRDISQSLTFYTVEAQEKQNQYHECVTDLEHVKDILEKARSNIEIVLRFKQGLVEIPYAQEKPVPSLNSAILIEKLAIDKKNQEIQNQGQKKINLMDEIKTIKYEVEEHNYQLKKKLLTIERIEQQTREVQLLKVKKEMQQYLTKKDMKLNDLELQNLQNQIQLLITATDKRIQIYQKKEEKINEQIEFILRENEQLRIQGGNLEHIVQQRQKISEMMFKKNVAVSQSPGTGTEERTDNEAFDKFQQIATNRKLFDLAKRQTEEIELLREELNKLKARTFANFSAVQK